MDLDEELGVYTRNVTPAPAPAFEEETEEDDDA
jgi:hypothetical protein